MPLSPSEFKAMYETVRPPSVAHTSSMHALDLFRLDGKVTVAAVAAGSAVGQAVCQALAEAGASVIVGDRNLKKAQDVAAQLPARKGLMEGAGGHLATEIDLAGTEVRSRQESRWHSSK